MKTFLLGLLVILITLFIFSDFFVSYDEMAGREEFLDKVNSIETLRVGTTTLRVELANTEEERTRGLSGRESIEDDYGMLFLFDVADNHGIWMKDMNFAIDIFWLNGNFNKNNELESLRVVDLKKSVLPETFPEIFRPDEIAIFVLETRAGLSDELEIDKGDIFQIR